MVLLFVPRRVVTTAQVVTFSTHLQFLVPPMPHNIHMTIVAVRIKTERWNKKSNIDRKFGKALHPYNILGAWR